MRNLLKSLFAGSNNVRSTSSMKENASMIRSTHTPRRGFGLRSLVAAVAVVFSLAAGQSAQAVDITFDLTELPGKSSPYSLTSGGYTLLFTSIGISSFTGSPGGVVTKSSRYFSISKTAGATDLIFKSYVVDSIINDNASSFNLTGGTGTSNGNTLTAYTTFNYNGSYSLVGSQTVTYNPVNFRPDDGPGSTEVTLNALTFTAVPEPSTYALGAIATGVMAAIARRRKARKA
jgi:hypothetical protein